jgi:DNA-binding NarL/FixJ family response regulator
VEDSASVRRLIRSMAVGLAAYNCYRSDFALMDIPMCFLDGTTATAQIKAADPAARIIIVTDYDQADLRQAAWQAGACCGYVVKEDLLELVRLLSLLTPGPAPPRG